MTGRLLGLDILRAVAMLLVLGAHLKPAPVDEAGWLVATLTARWGGGWVGVDLFFVLSGFLVSGLLFQEYQRTGTVHPGRFLIRRAFKIYPPFYVLLVVVLTTMAVAVNWRIVAAEVLFMQNYATGVTLHTWSLAVEEHFYLTLAALVWWLVRRYPHQPFRWIPRIWLVVAVACLAMRVAISDQPYADRTHIFPTHLRIDGLMFGVLLGYGWHCGELQQRTAPHGRTLIAAGVIALSPAFLWSRLETPWIWHVGLTMFYLGAGALLLGLLAFDLRPTRLTRGLAAIGASSYSIYLWHGPIQQIARYAFGSSWPVYACVYIVAAIGIGIAMARLVEVPSLAIRDRHFPRVKQPSQTEGQLLTAPAGM